MRKTDQLKKEIGASVANRRKELGLSQEALARLCDLSRPTIAFIEKGQRGTSVTTLKSLESALQLPDNQLVDFWLINKKSGVASPVQIKAVPKHNFKIYGSNDLESIRYQQQCARDWKNGLSSCERAVSGHLLIVDNELRLATGDPFGWIAVRVMDNSMSPVVESGDVIVVRFDEKPEDGDLVLVELDGQVTVRRFVHTVNVNSNKKYAVTILMACNQCYAPVHLKSRDESEVVLGRIMLQLRDYTHDSGGELAGK